MVIFLALVVSALLITIQGILYRSQVRSLKREIELMERQASEALQVLTTLYLQGKKMEETTRLINNATDLTRLMNQQSQDPEWVEEFSRGRENFQWN